jgi:hypothetical protein
MCIYCPERRDSPEHFLPAALGDFGESQILHDRVCQTCNNEIGRAVETQFLRAGPIALFRWVLGVEGRNGQPPTPFYRGAGGAPPILNVGPLRGAGYDILWEVEWATRNVTPARQVVFRDRDQGFVPVLVTDRVLRDRAAFRPVLAERGIPNAVPAYVWADDEDREPLEAMLTAEYGPLPEGVWDQEQPAPDGREVPLRAEVRVTQPFFRAVAKIVFHYALKVFPDLNGPAPELQPIRDYVRHGHGEDNHFVQELPGQIVGNLRDGGRPEGWCHLLYVERNARYIVGYAQFFVSAQHLPRPWQVRIGPNPGLIARPRSARPERRGHAFTIRLVEGGGRPRGDVVDMEPAQLIVLP